MAKQTLQGTKKKKIVHVGFLVRMQTTSGQRILKRRRRKGRKKITVI